MMTEEDLRQALAHDLALKRQELESIKPLNVAAGLLRDASAATRGAECALLISGEDGVEDAQGAAQMALRSLEQSLVVLGSMRSDE